MDVIETVGLSKRYILGERSDTYRTLRDTIASTVKRPEMKASGRKEIWALRDVTASVRAGEVLGIIGANGAGKSTFLKILARITRPTAGISRTRGRVGALLEVGTGFHLELTGRENIFLNGAVLGMSRREIRRRFDEIVAFSGVEEFLDTPVKRYSSGMYLRLAFSIAAHLEPDLVIVDEVLAVGDVDFQRRCLGKMSEFGAAGRTVVFVSHDLGAIGRLCTRVWWLREGHIVMDGASEDVIDAYLRSFDDLRLEPKGSVLEKGPLRISDVGLVDDLGREISQPRRDQKLGIRIRLSVQDTALGLDLAVYLLNNKGFRILDEAWSEHNAGPLIKRAGVHEVSIMIPAILAAGRYTIGIWAGTRFEELFMREVMSFDVLPRPDDPQSSLTKDRMVQPQLLWNVERKRDSLLAL